MLAEHQCSDFGMDKKRFLGDGVVTGYGTVNGRKVFIYSEDATVLGGSTGKIHGAKIHYILKMARDMMVPVICLNDSGGARIQEGMDNVYGINADLLSERDEFRRGAPDRGHHGRLHRGVCLFGGPVRLYASSRKNRPRVYHRACRDQGGHGGSGFIRGPGRGQGTQHAVRRGPLRRQE